ncbi:nucleotidyltransferase domain-containing protein [Candidatus Dependentiae bacterium]|nr:nucleotidyltransferase domain-containing protein [Candidatus Dependentiae bacterium]
MPLKKKYQDQLITIIHKHLPKCTIYLFGSQATGKNIHGSDIDIAVDMGKPIPYNIILKILVDIDDTTIPMKVDVVDLQTAPDNLKQDIIHEGIKWTN